MNKKEHHTVLKIFDQILPMLAVALSLVGIFSIGKDFSNLSSNYREILLATLASTIGILISFLALRILRQKRNGNIFISYTHQDKKFVEKLVQSLKIKRFNIIYDEDVIKVGDNIKDTILKTIDNSDLVILVISEKNTSDTFLKYELDYAKEKSKRILPIVLDTNSQIPDQIKGIRYADFSQDYEKSLNLLTKSLITALNEKSSS